VELNWAFGVKSWVVNVFSCGWYNIITQSIGDLSESMSKNSEKIEHLADRSNDTQEAISDVSISIQKASSLSADTAQKVTAMVEELTIMIKKWE
jgi:hypothetical protein